MTRLAGSLVLRRHVLLGLLAAAGLACQRPGRPAEEKPSAEGPPAAAQTPAAPGSPGSPQAGHLRSGDTDDEIAAIAERVPGFAGLYGEGGALVLALVDTARRAEALAAVRPLLAGRPAPARVVVRRAEYDFAQLRDWKVLAGRAYVDGWTSIDADEARNRVVVGVQDSGLVAAARARLEGAGIPPAALVVEVIRHACTLVGCEDQLVLAFDAPRRGPVRVELEFDGPPGDSGRRVVVCEAGRTCTGVRFAGVAPARVRARVVAGRDTTTQDLTPRRVVHRPNGPACPGTCRSAVDTLRLGGPPRGQPPR